MKKILAIVLLTAFLLSGCANAVGSTKETATSDEQPTQIDLLAGKEYIPTEPPTEPPTLEELATAKYEKILNSSVPDFAMLDGVEAMNQMNGMQAACESLALTSAINHFGYDLDNDDVVDDYLVYSDNFVTGYCGNPRRFYDGSGIYPPGLVTTAWNFIDENDAELYPFDTTGLSMFELYKFVNAGCPVMVWTTYDRYSPRIEQYKEYEGVDYPWYDTEHCVCLFGYDLEDNEVKIADSWYCDERWEDADRFERIYDEVGQFSMVLMDVSDLK